MSRSDLPATTLSILCLAVAFGCSTIRVPQVDYTFNAPIVTLPLGLPAPVDRRQDFADVFCSALQLDTTYPHHCEQFIEFDGLTEHTAPLPPLVDRFQVIVVAGIFSACLPRDQLSIYKQGIAQLKQEGLTSVDEIPVSASGGTDDHAKTIAAYIRAHQDSAKPFIAIGYSQGAADLLQAYVSDQVVHDSVRALITVAGAVGGSRLVDGIPSSLAQVLDGIDVTLPGCEIKGLAGLDALRRKDRYDFLTAHAGSLPRSYSIAARSTAATTSNVLQSTWKQLTAYSIDEDSQMIRDDAVVPGGAFLATALADHWAVTLPFKEAHNGLFDQLVNRNAYPRTALLEAMVRFVMKDLQDRP